MISQNALQSFQDEMGKVLNDPYKVLLLQFCYSTSENQFKFILGLNFLFLCFFLYGNICNNEFESRLLNHNTYINLSYRRINLCFF